MALLTALFCFFVVEITMLPHVRLKKLFPRVEEKALHEFRGGENRNQVDTQLCAGVNETNFCDENFTLICYKFTVLLWPLTSDLRGIYCK